MCVHVCVQREAAVRRHEALAVVRRDGHAERLQKAEQTALLGHDGVLLELQGLDVATTARCQPPGFVEAVAGCQGHQEKEHDQSRHRWGFRYGVKKSFVKPSP
jgi:hypothetical protein